MYTTVLVFQFTKFTKKFFFRLLANRFACVSNNVETKNLIFVRVVNQTLNQKEKNILLTTTFIELRT